MGRLAAYVPAPRRMVLEPRQPYIIGAMKHLDLDDAFVALLTRTIADDRYPLSPRIRTLKAILAKLRPEPVREPLPPPKVYAPPRRTTSRRRRRG